MLLPKDVTWLHFPWDMGRVQLWPVHPIKCSHTAHCSMWNYTQAFTDTNTFKIVWFYFFYETLQTFFCAATRAQWNTHELDNIRYKLCQIAKIKLFLLKNKWSSLFSCRIFVFQRVNSLTYMNELLLFKAKLFLNLHYFRIPFFN